MKYLYTVVFCYALVTNVFGQQTGQDCRCCTENHGQFDFWLGNWVVYDTLGKDVGYNEILQIQDGCVLQENWKSATMTGTSYNYYDPADSTWNQLWLDNRGGSLKLKGKYDDGVMVMRSDLTTAKSGKVYYNQISWQLNEDQSVTQTWDVFDENGNRLNTIFKGIYKKKGLD